MLLKLEGASEECDVVIGGEESDEGNGETAEHLENTQTVEAQPAEGR